MTTDIIDLTGQFPNLDDVIFYVICRKLGLQELVAAYPSLFFAFSRHWELESPLYSTNKTNNDTVISYFRNNQLF